jgi:hypothetical protein
MTGLLMAIFAINGQVRTVEGSTRRGFIAYITCPTYLPAKRFGGRQSGVNFVRDSSFYLINISFFVCVFPSEVNRAT